MAPAVRLVGSGHASVPLLESERVEPKRIKIFNHTNHDSMRRNRKQNTSGNGPAQHSVRLEFVHTAAKSVSVAGTFNDWRPGATEMVSLGDGRWLKELILTPGVYEYRLVVDGEWMSDPRARETVTNPFGESNSVLRVNGYTK